MTSNEQYLVDVIGFNPVERSMLASIFALAARRDPGFVQYDPATTASGTADIYLVDADNADALNEFRMLSKRANLPAVHRYYQLRRKLMNLPRRRERMPIRRSSSGEFAYWAR